MTEETRQRIDHRLTREEIITIHRSLHNYWIYHLQEDSVREEVRKVTDKINRIAQDLRVMYSPKLKKHIEHDVVIEIEGERHG